MTSLGNRMIGAAKLDAATYEEVEADTGATGQAALVVFLASVAAGFGMLRSAGLPGLVVAAVVSLVAWYAWALVTYLVGTRLLRGPRTDADVGQLLRTIGFSAAPGILRVLGIVPGIGGVVDLVAGVWMLVAMVVAVRHALDYESTGRAVAVCLVGFVVYLVAVFVLTVTVVTALGLGAPPSRADLLPLLPHALTVPADSRAHAAGLQLGGASRGCMRIAPSSRIVSPLSIAFSMMWQASAAYSSGRPRRDGKGTCFPRD